VTAAFREDQLAKKKFIVEVGMGTDLHGQDVTKAGQRAVRDAISRSCLCGLQEILGLQDFDDVHISVRIASPTPEQVDKEAILAEIPFGRKDIEVVEGGMSAPALYVEAFGDRSEDLVVALAAVTVSVDVD
jgi:uncharacterized protein (TIGR02058 family)